MKMKVIIDPGHGGKDAGAVNGDRYEKNDTRQMADKVKLLLEAQGVEVSFTRSGDDYVNIYERPKLAKGADALVSIHRNSFKEQAANGTEIWIRPNTTTGTALATCIMDRFVKTGIQSNRGIKKGNYIVLDTTVPACMIELGFISNEEDNQLFDTNFDQYSEDIASGICEFLGFSYNQTEPETNSLYRVQIGAFKSESNARAFLDSIRATGLDAYLVAPGKTKPQH